MPRRFFSATDITTDQVTLTGAEAHHLLRVLRMKQGDQVWLFDGKGLEALAEIQQIQTPNLAAQLRIVERRSIESGTHSGITIATAVPKGDRFAWMIEKLVELGTVRVIPLISQRSIVDPGTGKLDKLRKTIIEASKQCGRALLMQLDDPMTWNECLTQEVPIHQVYLAHPSGQPMNWPQFHNELKGPGARPPLFLVGPEGGFTDAEVESALREGGKSIQLGRHILRIETAAVALAALAELSCPPTETPSPGQISDLPGDALNSA